MSKLDFEKIWMKRIVDFQTREHVAISFIIGLANWQRSIQHHHPSIYEFTPKMLNWAVKKTPSAVS